MSKASGKWKKPINYSQFFTASSDEHRAPLSTIQIPKLKANCNTSLPNTINQSQDDIKQFGQPVKPLKVAKSANLLEKENSTVKNNISSVEPSESQKTSRPKRKRVDEDEDFDVTSNTIQTQAETQEEANGVKTRQRASKPTSFKIDDHSDDELELPVSKKMKLRNESENNEQKSTFKQTSKTDSKSTKSSMKQSDVESDDIEDFISSMELKQDNLDASEEKEQIPNPKLTKKSKARIPAHQVIEDNKSKKMNKFTTVSDDLEDVESPEPKKSSKSDSQPESRTSQLESENMMLKSELKMKEELLSKQEKETKKIEKQRIFDEKQISELTSRIEKLESELKSNTQEYEEEIESWKEQCTLIVEKAKKYKQAAKEAIHAKKSLVDDNDSRDYDNIQKLELQNSKLESKNSRLEEKNDLLEMKNSKLESQLAALKSKYDDDISKLEASLAQFRAEKEKEISRLLSKSSEPIEDSASLQQLKKENKSLSSKAELLQSQCERLLTNFEAAQHAADQLLEVNQLLESQSLGLNKDLTRIRAERDGLRAKSKEDDLKIAELSEKLQKQSILMQSAQKETKQTRKEDDEKDRLQKDRLQDEDDGEESIDPLRSSLKVALKESDCLGPLETFLTICKDEDCDSRWTIICRNTLLQRELHFTLEMLEEVLEYVPQDFKDHNRAGDPSELPDFLRRPIYFEPSALGPFVSKMISYLYKS